MNVLVVFSHPNPESFTRAIVGNLEKGLNEGGHQVDIVDLYGIGFDPVLKMRDLRGEAIPDDVLEHQERISKSEVIFFVHPIWWGGMPAMLKGYLDRVFTMGFAYGMGETGPEGKLSDKRVVIVRTTSLSEDSYRQSGVEDLISNMLVFKFQVVCGVKDLEQHVFYGVPSATDEVRKGYLDKAREIGNTI